MTKITPAKVLERLYREFGGYFSGSRDVPWRTVQSFVFELELQLKAEKVKAGRAVEYQIKTKDFGDDTYRLKKVAGVPVGKWIAVRKYGEIDHIPTGASFGQYPGRRNQAMLVAKELDNILGQTLETDDPKIIGEMIKGEVGGWLREIRYSDQWIGFEEWVVGGGISKKLKGEIEYTETEIECSQARLINLRLQLGQHEAGFSDS